VERGTAVLEIELCRKAPTDMLHPIKNKKTKTKTKKKERNKRLREANSRRRQTNSVIFTGFPRKGVCGGFRPVSTRTSTSLLSARFISVCGS
jgi:hypothetical protein